MSGVNPVAAHLIAQFKGEKMTAFSPALLVVDGLLCLVDHMLPQPLVLQKPQLLLMMMVMMKSWCCPGPLLAPQCLTVLTCSLKEGAHRMSP